jgi:hypothetical protein
MEDEKEELRVLLIDSDVLLNIEQRIRSDKSSAVSLKEEVRRVMFPTDVEKDGREYDKLIAARASGRSAQ